MTKKRNRRCEDCGKRLPPWATMLCARCLIRANLRR